MSLISPWITISLFSEKNNWATILSRGIKPFIRHVKKYDIGIYHVEFNYESSENIRFCFLLDSKLDLNKIITFTHKYFKDFFYINHLFPFSAYTTPNLSIFPFNSFNTASYGLYNPSYDSFFSSEFSQLIMHTLGRDKVTDSTIFSYAFIFHLSALKVFARFVELDSVIQYQSLDIDACEAYNPIYVQNEVFLFEMFARVFPSETKVSQIGFQYLSKWDVLCTTFIKSIYKDRSKEFLPEGYQRVSSVIKIQLGIGNDASKLLSFFIRKILASNSEKIKKYSFPSINANEMLSPKPL